MSKSTKAEWRTPPPGIQSEGFTLTLILDKDKVNGGLRLMGEKRESFTLARKAAAQL
jgi:hypothetical protein